MNKQFSSKKVFTEVFLCKKTGCEIYKFCSVESPKKRLGSGRLDDVVKGQYAINANSIMASSGLALKSFLYRLHQHVPITRRIHSLFTFVLGRSTSNIIIYFL